MIRFTARRIFYPLSTVLDYCVCALRGARTLFVTGAFAFACSDPLHIILGSTVFFPLFPLFCAASIAILNA
jgi:hypothetical protein